MNCFIALLLTVFALPAKAVEPSSSLESYPTAQKLRGSIGLYVENDAKAVGGPQSDQGYSNGFKLSFLSGEDDVPPWAKIFVWQDDLRQQIDKSQTNFGISLAQQIYTPNNTQDSNLILEDRPYAAWTYLGWMVNFRDNQNSQFLELDVGVIGPEAMGEKVQNEFHRMVQVDPARGWKNQLNTEPTLQLSYQRRMKFYEVYQGKQTLFDIIPFYGAGLGNVFDGLHAGGMLRVGWPVPNDFGPTRPSGSDGDSFVSPVIHTTSTPAWSYYFFAGARGIATARNIFLDGNTFRSSHHVKKYPFTAETEFGLGLQIHNWGLVWRFVTRSPEFEEKSEFNSFGSISISYSSY